MVIDHTRIVFPAACLFGALAIAGCNSTPSTGTTASQTPVTQTIGSVPVNTVTVPTTTTIASNGQIATGSIVTQPSVQTFATQPVSPITTTPIATTGGAPVSAFPADPISPIRYTPPAIGFNPASTYPTLSATELNNLFSGSTVYTTSVDDASRSQVGTFGRDQSLSVSQGGEVANGKWSLQGDQICYLLGGNTFCSIVRRVDSATGSPILYFERASGNRAGEPSVYVTGISRV